MRFTEKRNGFVSIFIVIFTAVLLSVVTVGFIKIMVSDQQQATTNDLSRSAYDSALAGVEDAKRAIIKYEAACEGGDQAKCSELKVAINSDSCNSSVKTLEDVSSSVASDGEVSVKTGGSNDLKQAYTCVKVQTDTSDYLGSVSADSYQMVPLASVGDFDTVKVEWFSTRNTTTNSISSYSDWAETPLFTSASKINNPPILRLQFIGINKTSGFSLADFDSGIVASSGNGSSTMFLYPVSGGNLNSGNLTSARLSKSGNPIPVTCSNLSSSVLYACSYSIKLPATVSASDQSAYLTLSAIYNSTDYRITLQKDSSSIKFNNVQPEIDSTGRANDLFRRVKTRIETVDPSYPYPEAAIDTNGSLCKGFSVTNNADDFRSLVDCD